MDRWIEGQIDRHTDGEIYRKTDNMNINERDHIGRIFATLYNHNKSKSLLQGVLKGRSYRIWLKLDQFFS